MFLGTCESSPLSLGFLKSMGFHFYLLVANILLKKLTTCCWTSVERRMLNPIKKRYPLYKGKGEASGMKSHLASSPIPARQTLRGLKQTLCKPRPKIPQRPRQNCVWVSPEEVQVSSGRPQGQGLWEQHTWVWHKPSYRRSPSTLPQELPELMQDWGKSLSEGTNKTLCVPGPRRKQQWSHKRLTQSCP